MKEAPNSKPRVRVKAGELFKTSNIDLPVSRLRLTDLGSGYANMKNISDFVDQEQVSALRWPKSLSTYDRMFYDHDVKLGYYLSQIFVEKAFNEPDVTFNKASEKSKEAAEFVKWNLLNMKHTLQEAIRNAYTCKKYGFSLLVKNYEPITSGKFAGKYPYKISKLSPRAQKSLNGSDPFLIDGKGDVAYARQDLRSLTNTYNLFKPDLDKYGGKSYVDIPRNKFMLFSYDSTNGNPLGCSVLTSVYKPWREKVLIADYQTIGTSKDLGGKKVATNI